jgi:hypothetical protein
LREVRATLLVLTAYCAALAAVGSGAFALVRGELISALAAADQRLEWMKPKAPKIAETVHTSLKPRLRGPLPE